ncbi:MAG: 50S ribosomal protein L11 methyltransferase [Deltaproteobacteria bacterium]|nr:50S ribosomal protein L11 methyltransferase [Deltaproteobacteria bacterium]
MSKEWLEIKVRGPLRGLSPGASKDAVIEAIINAGSPGVQEDSAYFPHNLILSHSSWAAPDDEAADIRNNAPICLTAYLDPDFRGVEKLKKDLKKQGWSFSSSSYRDKDWSVKWKANLKTIRVAGHGRAVVVKPGWRTVKKKARDVIVEIDPGMAFGTGGHETTRMCLKAMLWILKDKRFKPAASIFLDVGTGSGVLAIAAKKLGVKKAVGIDIDAVALGVARKNARINRAKIVVSSKSLEDVRGRFSIVTANIISRELKRLAPALVKRLAPNGFLILSGILGHEKAGIIEMFSAHGLEFVKGYSRGEWAAVVLLNI